MDTTLYLKPRAGLTVRDPRTKKPIPDYGAAVPNSSYWRRRRKDGDVEATTAAAVKKGADAAVKAAADAAVKAAADAAVKAAAAATTEEG